VFMDILLVVINCSLLVFAFLFLGRWLMRPFNKKYLYIYGTDTNFRERIYKIKEIVEFILRFIAGYLIFSLGTKLITYACMIVLGFISGLLIEEDRGKKKKDRF
uniref:hypothetical protein n=3 Tax=Treponema pedis TaxID=409322 RepID=UPI00178C2B52